MLGLHRSLRHRHGAGTVVVLASVVVVSVTEVAVVEVLVVVSVVALVVDVLVVDEVVVDEVVDEVVGGSGAGANVARTALQLVLALRPNVAAYAPGDPASALSFAARDVSVS